MNLGDAIHTAFSSVGITSERVERWLGRPCNCEERRRKLNQLGAWAKRILAGKTSEAKEHLDAMMKDDL